MCKKKYANASDTFFLFPTFAASLDDNLSIHYNTTTLLLHVILFCCLLWARKHNRCRWKRHCCIKKRTSTCIQKYATSWKRIPNKTWSETTAKLWCDNINEYIERLTYTSHCLHRIFIKLYTFCSIHSSETNLKRIWNKRIRNDVVGRFYTLLQPGNSFCDNLR